ncbi:MAG: hypothetical protein HY721_19160 [Planctomycetes bacterium]|nr:hypothetical protein [Planctomycetota bacterium]
MTPALKDDETPYFAWDRPLTVREIKERLRTSSGIERDRLVAWILREAAFRDVWQFLTPREVDVSLVRIERFLGRRRDFWRYIIREWHELGKL